VCKFVVVFTDENKKDNAVERSQKEATRTIVAQHITFVATKSLLPKVFFVVKFLINERNLKFLMSTKSLRCLAQNREEYSTTL
jgi:hypothetical protein